MEKRLNGLWLAAIMEPETVGYNQGIANASAISRQNAVHEQAEPRANRYTSLNSIRNDM